MTGLFVVAILQSVLVYVLMFVGAAVTCGITGEPTPSGWVILGASIAGMIPSVVHGFINGANR